MQMLRLLSHQIYLLTESEGLEGVTFTRFNCTTYRTIINFVGAVVARLPVARGLVAR